MGKTDLIEALDDPDFRYTGIGNSKIENSFEIKPNDFLEFAEKDLAANYTHKDINALSNAKRALDCQLDSLIIAFGLYSIAQSENWNFPKKIQKIKELGIVAPRVLEKINKIRKCKKSNYC